MPRIRTIKPEFWTDGTIIGLSPFARLLYIGMWNFAICDDGHVDDDLIRLKIQILPMDNVDISALLQELIDAGRVARIQISDGKTFLHVTRLRNHQKVDGRWTPRCPACSHANSANPAEPPQTSREVQRAPLSLVEPPRTSAPEGKGKEGKVKEGNGGEMRKRNPHPIPTDFPVTDEMREWASKVTPAVDVDRQTFDFIHYWSKGAGQGKKKSDWVRTWQNNMKTKQGWAERDGWKPKPPPSKDMTNPMNW